MATENKGIVYLLTNECMPGIVKIGMTSREDMDARLRELYTTGVPLPFDCVYACKVDCFKELEQALHEAFEPQRINPNREFFRIKPSQAIGILKLFNKGNVTAEVVNEMENDLAEEDEKTNPKRRSSINFTEMGLNVGDSCLPFVDSIDDLQMCDDCNAYILTNIKGPITLSKKAIKFLDNELISDWQPDVPMSKESAYRLKSLL